MKASTPSLVLFFVTSTLAVLFRLGGYEMTELCCRSVIVPSLFIYYFVSNNYRISAYKIIIFLALFIRDVLNVIKIKESAFWAFICVLFVYVLLLNVAFKEVKKFKFDLKDSASILIIFLGIGTICYSVLNLKLENLELNFFWYVIFGIVLSLLSIVSILNYTKNGNHVFFSALLMCICYMISDIFFVVFKFYFYTRAFALISLITQFLSYFLMVNYFIEKDRLVEEIYEV